MTPEEHYRLNIDDVDFTAEPNKYNSDYMDFVIQGGGIYTRAKLHMENVILLHKYLGEEIEIWLKS